MQCMLDDPVSRFFCCSICCYSGVDFRFFPLLALTALLQEHAVRFHSARSS